MLDLHARLIAALLGGVALLAGVSAAVEMLLGTLGQNCDVSTLVEIDPATGSIVRTIGSVGYTVNGPPDDETTGVLYGTTAHLERNDPEGLITIDPATAMPTELGPVPGLPIYFAQHGTFHLDSNLMYALDATEDCADIVNLVAIDTASRSVVRFAPLPGNDMHTLAFVTLSAP
jgi:hypothetical protein